MRSLLGVSMLSRLPWAILISSERQACQEGCREELAFSCCPYLASN